MLITLRVRPVYARRILVVYHRAHLVDLNILKDSMSGSMNIGECVTADDRGTFEEARRWDTVSGSSASGRLQYFYGQGAWQPACSDPLGLFFFGCFATALWIFNRRLP